jgi:hypothetical protein
MGRNLSERQILGGRRGFCGWASCGAACCAPRKTKATASEGGRYNVKGRGIGRRRMLVATGRILLGLIAGQTELDVV